MTNVRIGQWVAQGGAGSDGFYIKDQGLQGVFNGVGVRADSVPRPQAHGDFDVPVFRSPRIVSITGPCIADSAERLDWYSNQLSGLLADGQSGQVIFDIPGGARWGNARLVDQPEFDVTLWGERADWMLQLKFANPRLFGEVNVSATATSVTSVNYGNFPATSVLTVAGSMAGGYTINGPLGRQYIVTRALVTGQPHTIDQATGLLSIGGATVFGGVSRPDTWATPGGGSVVMSITGTGSGTITARTPDTFI